MQLRFRSFIPGFAGRRSFRMTFVAPRNSTPAKPNTRARREPRFYAARLLSRDGPARRGFFLTVGRDMSSFAIDLGEEKSYSMAAPKGVNDSGSLTKSS